MDSNAVFAILLLIAGLAILSAEIFIPSGGLLGVITFLTLVVSLIFAYRAWGVSHPNVFMAFCILAFLLVPTVIVYGFYQLPHTAFGKRVLLEAPEAKDLTPFSKKSEQVEKLIGRFGSALTPLNPGGLVNVDGERLHAMSDGLSVESGESIQVVGVRGTRVIVRPGTPPPDQPNEHLEQVFEDRSPLDFEFPPSL